MDFFFWMKCDVVCGTDQYVWFGQSGIFGRMNRDVWCISVTSQMGLEEVIIFVPSNGGFGMESVYGVKDIFPMEWNDWFSRSVTVRYIQGDDGGHRHKTTHPPLTIFQLFPPQAANSEGNIFPSTKSINLAIFPQHSLTQFTGWWEHVEASLLPGNFLKESMRRRPNHPPPP